MNYFRLKVTTLFHLIELHYALNSFILKLLRTFLFTYRGLHSESGTFTSLNVNKTQLTVTQCNRILQYSYFI